MAVLLVMFMTLSVGAASAATVNSTGADNPAQKNVSKQTTSSTTNTATTLKTNSTRYEGTADTGTASVKSTSGTVKAAGSAKVIKVLIYSGSGASANCVNGVKSALATANSKNIVPGIVFSYASSTKLSSSILSGYNVLVMPGGESGAKYLNTISKSVIQTFVKNGGGYMGICAGAYSGTARTDGYYNGWGVAPHVYAKSVSYEGQLTMTITTAGAKILKRSGTVTLAHYNGAAMYLKGGGTIFGKYADSKTKYKGYADIVGDYYGRGRTVLIGSHPELKPQYPSIVATLAAWSSRITNTGSTTSSPGTTPTKTTLKVTNSQVVTAAGKVKAFYEKNKRMPSTVTVNGSALSMSKFLYLLTTVTTKINSGSTSTTTVKTVNSPSNSQGSIKKGDIAKSEFISKAKSITSYINTYNRVPNYTAIKLGKLNFTKMLYMFSKILAFYGTNHRLPNYVSMS